MHTYKDLPQGEQYLNPRQFAKREGISRQRVQQLLHAGALPGCKRVGVMWLIPASLTYQRKKDVI